LLGIPRGIIAITKSDLVDADTLGMVRLEIEEFVRGSFLENAPIVPVSSRSGAGLDELKVVLRRAAREVVAKDATQNFRLPIDRSFAMKGFGTVVTGTLISGTVKLEEEVELYPARKRLRVRGLHSGGKQIERAVAGRRTAVNLAGIEHEEITRGMVLAAAGLFEATQRVDARVTLLASAPPLKNRARVHYHQGTAEAIAEVILLNDGGGELKAGGSAFAQLRLDKPLLLLPGDRFILRRYSPVVTIGGGTVLDARAPRHKRKDAAVAPFLGVLEHGTREEILGSLVEAAPRGMTLPEIVARTGWIEAEARATADRLAAAKRVRLLGGAPMVVAPAQAVTSSAAAIRKAVETFHRANPLLPGIPKQELRARAGRARVEIFEAALNDLVAARTLVVAGDLVGQAGREIALSAEESRAKELIEREFESAGLTVPDFASVLAKLPVDAARAQKILQILLREKVLVKISSDLVFHRNTLLKLREMLAKYRKERGARLPITVFKELAGITRKYAIPLLEHLDREQVTRRAGDERVIL
jgi:selenocysteine-specific elongation factor